MTHPIGLETVNFAVNMPRALKALLAKLAFKDDSSLGSFLLKLALQDGLRSEDKELAADMQQVLVNHRYLAERRRKEAQRAAMENLRSVGSKCREKAALFLLIFAGFGQVTPLAAMGQPGLQSQPAIHRRAGGSSRARNSLRIARRRTNRGHEFNQGA